jgi:hypothetical protein
MQEKNLYEYSIIRVMPKVEREEFLNIGVVLFCKKAKFIKMLYQIDEQRLSLLCKEFDLQQLHENMEAFQKIVSGEKSGGPISQLDEPSRFRWLTAVRSSSIQTSRPHPGICEDLDQTLQRLFEDMVL